MRLGADSRGRMGGPAHAGSHGRKSELSWGVERRAGNKTNQLFLQLSAAVRVKGRCWAMLTEQPFNRKEQVPAPFPDPILPVPAEASRKPGDTEEITLQNPSCIVTRQNRGRTLEPRMGWGL